MNQSLKVLILINLCFGLINCGRLEATKSPTTPEILAGSQPKAMPQPSPESQPDSLPKPLPNTQQEPLPQTLPATQPQSLPKSEPILQPETEGDKQFIESLQLLNSLSPSQNQDVVIATILKKKVLSSQVLSDIQKLEINQKFNSLGFLKQSTLIQAKDFALLAWLYLKDKAVFKEKIELGLLEGVKVLKSHSADFSKVIVNKSSVVFENKALIKKAAQVALSSLNENFNSQSLGSLLQIEMNLEDNELLQNAFKHLIASTLLQIKFPMEKDNVIQAISSSSKKAESYFLRIVIKTGIEKLFSLVSRTTQSSNGTMQIQSAHNKNPSGNIVLSEKLSQKDAENILISINQVSIDEDPVSAFEKIQFWIVNLLSKTKG